MRNPLDFLFRKQVSATSYLLFQNVKEARWTDRNYQNFANEGYKKNAIAFKCIEIVATSCSAVPYILFSGYGKKRKEIDEHPILDLLRRPNGMMTRTTFGRYRIGYLLISGNSYVAGVGPKPNAPPTELWPIRPDRVTVIPGTRGMPAGFALKVNDKETVFPVDALGRSAINHWKTFNPTSDWYGMSPLEAAAKSVDVLNAGASWNLALRQNSCKPSGAFIVEAELDDVQRERLKRDLTSEYSGAQNAGRPMVLGNGLKWEGMSFSPKEMDFLASDVVQERHVALVFGVPGQLIGLEGSQTQANWEQANLHFHENIVLPMKAAECEELNQWLVPAYGDAKLNLWYDEDAIPALEPKREKQWQRAEKASWLTVNEKRELTGYGRYESGKDAADRLVVNASLVPLEVAVDDSVLEPLDDTSDVEENPDKSNAAEAELKAAQFDVTSESGKTRLWLAQDRVKRNFEKRMKKDVREFFAKEKVAMKSALATMDRSLFEFEVTRVLQANLAALKGVYERNLRAVAGHFGSEVLEHTKSLSEEIETKGPKERFTISIERFLKSRIETATTKVQAVTKKKLLKALKDADERDDDGHLLTIDIQKTVDASYDSWEDSRSETISRTEVHTTANEASREAAKALGIPGLKKEWIAARDDRTRDSHSEVDGTVVDLDTKFEVKNNSGMDLMDGPGDKNASPENVINCRCTLVYHSGSTND